MGLLDRFFSVVVDTAQDEGGLVIEFDGDAALCVLGAPADHGDTAGAALRAARRICDAVAAAAEVDVGIGVACGRVWAGQVGAASRLEYTVIGDPVNEAARLTDLAKDHPGRAMAGDPTVLAAGPAERQHWVRGEDVALRGRGEPTRTWVRRWCSVRADDDEHVLGLERADEGVVEAQRAPAPGHRQDDVAQ